MRATPGDLLSAASKSLRAVNKRRGLLETPTEHDGRRSFVSLSPIFTKVPPGLDEVLLRLVAEDERAVVVITYDPKKALWLHVLQRAAQPSPPDRVPAARAGR